jgi:hypothetical protein
VAATVAVVFLSVGGVSGAAQKGFLSDVETSPDYWCPVERLGSGSASYAHHNGAQPVTATQGQLDLVKSPVVAVLHVPGEEGRLAELGERLRVPGWSLREEGGSVTLVNGTNALDPAPSVREYMLANADGFTQYSLVKSRAATCLSSGDIDGLGAIGAALGHRRVWREFLLGRLRGMAGRPPSDADVVLVLEDDALFTPTYASAAAAFAADLAQLHITPRDFDMLVLGWGNREPDARPLPGAKHAMRMCGRWWGLHAYVLSKRGAERLWREHLGKDPHADSAKAVDALGGAFPVYRHVDHFIGYLNAVRPDFVVLRPSAPIVNAKGKSTIHHFLSECWTMTCIILKIPNWVPWIFVLWTAFSFPAAIYFLAHRLSHHHHHHHHNHHDKKKACNCWARTDLYHSVNQHDDHEHEHEHGHGHGHEHHHDDDHDDDHEHGEDEEHNHVHHHH